jgi:thymidylate kinase
VDAYHDLAARFPERYVVVDGRRNPDEIAVEIRDHLR